MDLLHHERAHLRLLTLVFGYVGQG
jgi:hypothetical protein